jgi:iron(III) transport system ATP-binding protein
VRRERPGTGTAVGFDGVGGEPVPIEVRGLHKRYGAKEAVAGVDLTIDPGTFLVLLGPSGSGKSTLVRCLAGIERVSAGRISFGGAEVDGPDRYLPPERRDLAMVFQDFALWPHLTAEDNVAFALKRRRLPSATRRAVARDALRRVGLADLHQRYPGQLSGGEQQRVALARALVARPGLLLFDEPLSNLDADRRERLRVDIGTMVREQGATAVYITHDQAEAFALADTVGVLSAGRLVQLGAPEEIYHHPADAFVARFTGLAGELRGRVRAPVPGPPEPGSDRLVRSRQAAGRWFAVDVLGTDVVGRALGTAPLAPGSPVRLLLRAPAVTLADPAGPLAATVRASAFCGSGYQHVVELDGGQRLTGIAHDRRLAIGGATRLAIDPVGCLLVAEPARVTSGPADDPRLATSESAVEEDEDRVVRAR